MDQKQRTTNEIGEIKTFTIYMIKIMCPSILFYFTKPLQNNKAAQEPTPVQLIPRIEKLSSPKEIIFKKLYYIKNIN